MSVMEKPPLVWKHMLPETKLAAIRIGLREGLSGQQIGKRYFASRAAVTSCANRHGISLKKFGLADNADLAQAKATTIKRMPGAKDNGWQHKLKFHLDKNKQKAAAERLEMSGAASAFVAPVDLPQRISLAELHEDQCKWPFEDEQGIFFCAALRKARSSYCPTHHSRAYSRVPT